VVLTSRKENAKRFKKWLTSEVIPSIRKTGAYGNARTDEEVLVSLGVDPASATMLVTNRRKLEALTAQQAVTMTAIIPHIAPLVRDADGKPRASSLDVARVFDKRHADVLRAIDELVSQLETTQRNFASSSYLAGNGKMERCITMDRDGFTLLAMGFTGAEALKWKLAYIAAFNAMEAELSARVLTPAEQNLANAQLAVEFERRQIALDIASVFGKRHAHVLRDIDVLVSQMGAQSNFGYGSYTLQTTGEQQHRLYTMDRDGFTLLAFGPW